MEYLILCDILRFGIIYDNIRYYMSKKSTKTKLTEELKTQLRTEFVQGVELKSGKRKHFSIEDLIKKYKVAPATLYRASQSEGWKALREQYNLEFDLLSDSKKTMGELYDVNSFYFFPQRKTVLID